MQLQTTDNSTIDCSKVFDDNIMQKIDFSYLNGKPIMPILNKLANESHINPNHDLLTAIMQKRGFTEFQMGYFQVFINDWFVNGRKMRKNDFGDFLYIGFVNKNELGITFDKKVARFLQQNDVGYDFTQAN